MEPVTVITALLYVGSLVSSARRREAAGALRAARQRLRDAARRARENHKRAVGLLNVFGNARKAAVELLFPRSRRAAERLGVEGRLFGRVSDVFGGRSWKELERLFRKVRAMLLHPRSPLDKTVGLASATALLVHGLDKLDRAGVVEIPVLQETLSEVASGLSPAAEHLFDGPLTDLGDMTVGDFVTDSLLIFSVAKIGYNLLRTDGLKHETEDCLAEARRCEGIAQEMKQLGDTTERRHELLREESYQLYKWSLLGDLAAATAELNRAGLRARLADELTRALRAWWTSMTASVSTA